MVATLAHFAIDPSSSTPLVGASAAISGVLDAYLVLYPYNRVKALVVFYIITVYRASGGDSAGVMVRMATVPRLHLAGTFIPGQRGLLRPYRRVRRRVVDSCRNKAGGA